MKHAIRLLIGLISLGIAGALMIFVIVPYIAQIGLTILSIWFVLVTVAVAYSIGEILCG